MATSALAGERSRTPPVRRAIAPILPVTLAFADYDEALTIGGDYIIRMQSAPAPRFTLADFENSVAPRFDVVPIEARPAELTLSYAKTDLAVLTAWRLTDTLEPVTATANGVYAVREQLADYRKPRISRPSPLNAMLVLRIDGKEESSPFSVGGGGVAAALWQVLPR